MSFLEPSCYNSWAGSTDTLRWLLINRRKASNVACTPALSPYTVLPTAVLAQASDGFSLTWELFWCAWGFSSPPHVVHAFACSGVNLPTASPLIWFIQGFCIYPPRLCSSSTSTRSSLTSPGSGRLQKYWLPRQRSQQPDEVGVILLFTEAEARSLGGEVTCPKPLLTASRPFSWPPCRTATWVPTAYPWLWGSSQAFQSLVGLRLRSGSCPHHLSAYPQHLLKWGTRRV